MTTKFPSSPVSSRAARLVARPTVSAFLFCRGSASTAAAAGCNWDTSCESTRAICGSLRGSMTSNAHSGQVAFRDEDASVPASAHASSRLWATWSGSRHLAVRLKSYLSVSSSLGCRARAVPRGLCLGRCLGLGCSLLGLAWRLPWLLREITLLGRKGESISYAEMFGLEPSRGNICLPVG